MSQMGLGRVKTPKPIPRVEQLTPIAAYWSDFALNQPSRNAH
jgi:hypothetical protein